jgi:hypothetical protein
MLYHALVGARPLTVELMKRAWGATLQHQVRVSLPET